MAEILVKVGNKRLPSDPAFTNSWRDGQIIDIMPDGTYINDRMTRRHHCVIILPFDYWGLRGSVDWKSTKPTVYNNIKKYLCPVDKTSKLPWDKFYLTSDARLRCRDWFFDFKDLLDLGLITQSDFDSIYDKSKPHNPIYIDRDFLALVKHEDADTRKPSIYSNMLGTVSSGTYSIGSGLDYATITAFEADIAATLTGNLTGEHNAEETAISTSVVFDTDTANYLLKLTAQSGDKHDGKWNTSKARINYGTYDDIRFDETNDGDLTDIEVSDLQLDAIGTWNRGIRVRDAQNATINILRNIVRGNSVAHAGIDINDHADTVNIINNVIYDFTEGTYGFGILLSTEWYSGTYNVYNNTLDANRIGIRMDTASENGSPTKNIKNNLVQGSTSASFSDAGAGYGNTSKNVSEDANSPDVAYRNLNCHDGNSCFTDYANNDYTLVSGGDEISTLDDGDDLSGTFTDDIIDQTRSTWYIGASEIVAGDPTTLPPTTLAPTTLPPTTLAPTTLAPTTLAPTTAAPTTLPPTTVAPTTAAPTTLAPTTLAPTTLAPTTLAPTTLPPTTLAPTTLEPTTLPPTTLAPTTVAPTTIAPTTIAPTTLSPTTIAPTTVAPTTLLQTTLAPTTIITTTLAPTTPGPFAARRRGIKDFGFSFRDRWRN